MVKKLLSRLLLGLANLLMSIRYGFAGGSVVVKTHTTDHIKIDTIHGMSKVAAMYVKSSSVMYEIKTEGGKTLIAADDHVVYTEGKLSGAGVPVAMNKLNVGDTLVTISGPDKIKSIKKSRSMFTFDMTVANPTNTYWSDGILSHNSVTTAIFMVWYILANVDKTVVCLSANQDKVEDLIDKIKVIIKNLPYHLKPGIVKWDVMQMHFDNGCKIKGQTTTVNSAAGITADLLYMDEFALINKNFIREFYRTAYPTISASKTSKVIITSTPRGLNKFHEIYDGALKGKNDYNPLRVDWWEVPGHDDAWRAREIANLGSLEDFNQEYGNMFLAGSSMILSEPELKKVKLYEETFVHHDIEELDDADVNYKGILTWHPLFDLSMLDLPTSFFTLNIDLGSGDGQDYSVVNIKMVLPMAIEEINRIEYFTDTKDFFKQVQIGMIRCNTLAIPQFADTVYKIITALFRLDNFKMVIEVNHDGKWFIEKLTTVFGPRNVLDEDFHIVKFRHRVDDKMLKPGIKMTEPVKKYLCSSIKDRVKFNQVIICEKTTVSELLNFTQNENGTYSATSGHDDIMMTEILATAMHDTDDFADIVEEMLQNCPEVFLAEVDKFMANADKVRRVGDGGDDDDDENDNDYDF